MQKYEALRDEEALQPLSDIERRVEANSFPWNKSYVTMPSKPAMFENDQGEQPHSKKFFLPRWKTVIPVKMFGRLKRVFHTGQPKCIPSYSRLEENVMSGVSLQQNVVQLCKYENEGNCCSPMICHDSQVSFKEAWVATKELYDYAEYSKDDSQVSFKEAWVATKELYDYAEYSKDVYQYLRQSEIKHQPHLAKMRQQPDINLEMRSILVDWLVEVTNKRKLQNDTLHLSVSLIDRFLSMVPILQCNLPILGATSMLVATKYEETRPLRIEEVVDILGGSYSKSQFVQIEYLILKALDFNINIPTVYCFLRYICCATDMHDTVLFLAQYLCELALLEAEPFFRFLPSQIAAAAISLSNYTFGYEPWDSDLEQTTGYKFEDLTNIINCLHIVYHNYSSSHLQAIRKKYSSATYHDVSSITPPEKLCF